MRSVTRIGPRQRWPGLSAGSSMLQTYALIIVDAVAPNQLAHLSRYFGGLAAVTFVRMGHRGVRCVVFADYLGRRRTLMLSLMARPERRGAKLLGAPGLPLPHRLGVGR